MELPSTISINEKLGREEWSRSAARRAHRKLASGVPAHARVNKFTPPRNSNELSINRMDFAPEAELAEIGSRNAEHSGNTFWGWYTFTALDVEEVGCSVRFSPLPDNPYHGDIVLPVALDAEDRRDALREYAMGLAYRAMFQPWGDQLTDQ